MIFLLLVVLAVLLRLRKKALQKHRAQTSPSKDKLGSREETTAPSSDKPQPPGVVPRLKPAAPSSAPTLVPQVPTIELMASSTNMPSQASPPPSAAATSRSDVEGSKGSTSDDAPVMQQIRDRPDVGRASKESSPKAPTDENDTDCLTKYVLPYTA